MHKKLMFTVILLILASLPVFSTSTFPSTQFQIHWIIRNTNQMEAEIGLYSFGTNTALQTTTISLVPSYGEQAICTMYYTTNYIDRLLGRKEGEDMNLITYVTDRAGHDMRYAIDSTKLQRELGWEPSLQFEEGIEKTVKWYLENQAWMDNITSGEYEKYYESMYANR